MSARLAGSMSRIRRGVALAAGVLSICGLLVVASGAGAAPRPTVAQVQAKINKLTTQFNRISEQYDQASQRLSAAKTKLSRVSIHLKHARAQFQAGCFADARRSFAWIVDADPVDHYARFGLGLSAAREGDYRDAVSHLALAVAMRPDNRHSGTALRSARAALARS